MKKGNLLGTLFIAFIYVMVMVFIAYVLSPKPDKSQPTDSELQELSSEIERLSDDLDKLSDTYATQMYNLTMELEEIKSKMGE